MSRIALTPESQDGYQRLFATCVIRAERAAEVEERVDAIMADRDRYWTVGRRLSLPWFVVAVLHEADTGRDFTVHLHNGDPLTERTRHLPDGRPVAGEPPFRWEDSAADALSLHHFDRWSDWSIAGALFKLEEHGGWGYRLHHPEVLSPYLWNYSTHYHQGKYVADDTWNETAVAQRCGAAVLLRRLVERALIEFSAGGEPPVHWPLLRYAEADTSPWADALQRFLNNLPGIFVKVDGRAGPRTSDAFRMLTGRYLPGDPRGEDES
jgi:lysozyme family protein